MATPSWRDADAKKVHSFDLESNAPGVTACNMASTPLKDASVDVAVFSLALMGTDYGTFLEEAHRVRPLATRVSPSCESEPVGTRPFSLAIFQGRAQSSRARPSMTGAYYSRAPEQTDDGLLSPAGDLTLSSPAGRGFDIRRSFDLCTLFFRFDETDWELYSPLVGTQGWRRVLDR